MFKQQKSLTELQEEDERLDSEITVHRKRLLLKQLNKKMGKDGWKMFSDNGKSSGINFARIIAWLKNN